MFVQQFYVEGLAHTSYLLGGKTTCAIVDPKRDVEDYLAAANEMHMTVTHILETHLHADFVSGHMDLARATGATVYAPRSGRCEFDHVAVGQGDTFGIEDMHIEVLDTPGHTPDCVCYVVTDRSRGDAPAAVFTGDTLFVGDVGRPDLFPGKAEVLASNLYDSLHDKVMALPDGCLVYPAHGAGSLCGRAMGAMRWSTIGYERQYNGALQHKTKEAFSRSLLTGMPQAPDHFARCSAINRKGPARVDDLPVPRALSVAETASLVDAGHVVVDARGGGSFGAGHIPGAYNIAAAGNFGTFAGWLLPPDKPIVLVADSVDRIGSLVVQLRRVGLDQVTGYLKDGMEAWVNAGRPIDVLRQMSVHDLKALCDSGQAMTIVDVRARGEWDGGHIDGATFMPLPDTRTRYAEIDANTPVALVCRTGGRAGTAGSILQQHGVGNLAVVAGGMSAWVAAGYAPECPMCALTHGPQH